jgi:hypothetical protein
LNFDIGDLPAPTDAPKEDRSLKPKVRNHIPSATENPLTKTRTFSFKQLYDFNNLYLNKSFLRKRVRSSEEDIHKNQKDIEALFKWKEELTQTRADDAKKNQDKFDQIDQRHAMFVK